MTEHIEYTGTGTESDPITISTRQPAPDQADVAVSGLASAALIHAADFRSNADLSSNLPADLRELVSKASSAITSTLDTVRSARIKAERFRSDVSMYPQGREMLAGEAIKAATDEINQA